MATATLGSHLGRLILGITDLILQESDAKRRRELKKQLRLLIARNKRLVDQQVPRDTATYRRATEALVKANEEIAAAKKGIANVASSMKRIATAIGWLEKVVSTVG